MFLVLRNGELLILGITGFAQNENESTPLAYIRSGRASPNPDPNSPPQIATTIVLLPTGIKISPVAHKYEVPRYSMPMPLVVSRGITGVLMTWLFLLGARML